MAISGLIYRVTNIVTNKVYVGQTTRNLSDRIAGHYDSYALWKILNIVIKSLKV